MRVISGSARGTRLKMVPGDTTRPIMDRVKENLFNILGDAVYDAVWLDLFAGTGQVGIEALSRGAEQVVFIDSTRAAIRTIHENLRATRLADRGQVIKANAFQFLNQEMTKSKGEYDLVYIAPPQYKEMWLKAMAILNENPAALLRPEGLVVVQIDPKEYDTNRFDRLNLVDKRRYGRTLLLFYEPCLD